MKKSIKSIALGLVTIGLLAGCFGQGSTSSSDSQVSSSTSSTATSETNITSSSATSSSTTTSTTSEIVKTQITLNAAADKTTLEVGETIQIASNVDGVSFSVNNGGTITATGLFTASASGEYVITAHKDGNFLDGTLTITVLTPKTDIVLTAEKTNLDLNESVTINSSVEGVTLSTTEGATIENGVFTATKEGTYVVTASKEGRYNEGTLTINVAFKQTEAKVKAALKQLKEGENYTLTSHSMSFGESIVYRTKDYYYDTDSQEGLGLFTNIDPNVNSERVAHYIKVVDDKLIIGNDIVYAIQVGDTVEEKVATNLNIVDGFAYVDIDALTFVEGENGFYVEDYTLIEYMGALLHSQVAARAFAIQYHFDENYDLVANLLYKDMEGNIDETTADIIGDLVYTNIGKTAAPVLDEEYKKVSVAGEGMSQEVASSFMLQQGHIKTTLKQVIGEDVKTIATSEYNFDEENLLEETVISGTTVRNLYKKGEDNYAYKYGVNAQNEIAQSMYEEWEYFTFPFATLDLSQFRQTTENTYSYLGMESSAVAKDLTWLSVNKDIAFITAHEKDGKIASFTCESRNFVQDISEPDDAYPEYVIAKIIMEVEVLPFEEVPNPQPFEADADTVKIQAYLDDLTKADANYTMFIGDYAWPNDYKMVKVMEDVIYIQEYKDGVNKYTGYYRINGGVVKFTASKEGDKVVAKVLETLQYDENKPMVDLMNFNIAPETMRLDEDGNIVFKENVFGGGKGLTDQFHFAEWAIDGTIALNCRTNIYQIIFNYMEGEQYREYASIYGYGTTKFAGSFETALEEALPHILEREKPTTWSEESPDVYAKLVDLLGENADVVPYLYDEAYSGFFDKGERSSETTVKIKLTENKTFTTAYRKALTALCVEKGFTKASDYSAKLTIGSKILTVGSLGSSINVIYKDA